MTVFLPVITVNDGWFEEAFFLPWSSSKESATTSAEAYIKDRYTRTGEKVSFKIIEVPHEDDCASR